MGSDEGFDRLKERVDEVEKVVKGVTSGVGTASNDFDQLKKREEKVEKK